MEDKTQPTNNRNDSDEKGVNQPHDPASDIGAGRQIGDPLSGTLSDRAGDESFDDDSASDNVGKTSEDDDDL